VDNEKEQGRRRRVSRQSWKPNRLLAILQGLWKGAYSAVKVALGAVLTVLAICVVCGVVFVSVLADYLEGDIVPISGVQLEGFDLNQPSYVYYLDQSGNIQVLQKLYSDTESDWAYYDEIPENLIYAAVAIEDHRFFEHQGVDWFTTIKACVNMFVGSKDEFGGSSITQQLIKNLLLTEDEAADDVTVQRKVLEIFRATGFEQKYDKSVVLEWYMNYIYLGNRCKGVKSAAAKYFGKELEDLTAAECACLISITNNPSLYDPYRTKLDKGGKTGLEQNEERRINTLWRMNQLGFLSDEDYAVALEEEIVLKDGVDFEDKYFNCPNEDCAYRGKPHTFVLENEIYYCPECGQKTTIGEDATQEVYSWFVDTVIDDVIDMMMENAGLDPDNKDSRRLYRDLVSKGGYHIYSTLDMKTQTAVDNVYQNLDRIPTTNSIQQLQSGIVVIDNKSGDIVAISGGVGDKTVYDAYNRATDAPLQPGSSLKPLTVYAPAFELGVINPASIANDMPLYYNVEELKDGEVLPEGEEPKLIPFPKNDEKTYSYRQNILSGIRSSINAVAVSTLNNMGLEYSFDFAKDKFGLSSLVKSFTGANGTVYSDVNLSPLGMGAPTFGVTVRQMATAYATFANNGIFREARTFTKVYNSEGEEILYNAQESRQILSEKTVNYINYCLDYAVEAGTGWAGDIPGQDVAGKTGTTSNKKDRWFCGFTDYYTASVWCGYDYPEIINLVGNTSNPACRLFKAVLEPLHTGKPSVELYDDSEFVWVGICQDSGLLATDGCAMDRGGRVAYANVYSEDVPTQKCNKHVKVDFCTVCNAPANEYCYLYEDEGLTTITSTYLVKMTQKEVDDIALACKYGLDKTYLDGTYVYLVDENGDPMNFFGIPFEDEEDKDPDAEPEKKPNEGLEYPYLVGTTHSKESWEAYKGTQVPTYPDVFPDIPGDDDDFLE